MNRKMILICFLILSGYLLPEQLQAKPLIEIVDLKWCRGITVSDDQEKNKEPIDICENGGLFSGSKLYLWMKVKGYQEALDKLRQGGRVTIIQRWRFHYYGSESDRIDLSMRKLSPDIINKLQQEINRKGYFDWRTWGAKDNLKARRYEVDFLDEYSRPLNWIRSQSGKMNIRIR